jgi:hypothetical protein
MSFENSAGLDVSNHYGPRAVGGNQGVIGTEGMKNEAAVNFDSDQLVKVEIPVGSVITQIVEEFSTGAVTAATVGAVDVAAATGAEAAYVATPLGGELTITGPTAGTVHVYYIKAL